MTAKAELLDIVSQYIPLKLIGESRLLSSGIGGTWAMIGKRYLSLFTYPDEDTGINQLLELLKSRDREFIDSLDRPVDLDLCTREEVEWLTKVAALIDYYLQLLGMDVPDWLRDERLAARLNIHSADFYCWVAGGVV